MTCENLNHSSAHSTNSIIHSLSLPCILFRKDTYMMVTFRELHVFGAAATFLCMRNIKSSLIHAYIFSATSLAFILLCASVYTILFILALVLAFRLCSYTWMGYNLYCYYNWTPLQNIAIHKIDPSQGSHNFRNYRTYSYFLSSVSLFIFCISVIPVCVCVGFCTQKKTISLLIAHT